MNIAIKMTLSGGTGAVVNFNAFAMVPAGKKYITRPILCYDIQL